MPKVPPISDSGDAVGGRILEFKSTWFWVASAIGVCNRRHMYVALRHF
jgi:hypothetical protein